MEKILGIILIFAAGYLMYRLQANAGGCCGDARQETGSVQCGSEHPSVDKLEADRDSQEGKYGSSGTYETGNEGK